MAGIPGLTRSGNGGANPFQIGGNNFQDPLGSANSPEFQHIMQLAQKLKEAMDAKQDGGCQSCQGGGKSGGAQGAGGGDQAGGLSLEELLRELRKQQQQNPQAVAMAVNQAFGAGGPVAGNMGAGAGGIGGAIA